MLEYDENEKNDCNNNNIELNVNQREGCECGRERESEQLTKYPNKNVDANTEAPTQQRSAVHWKW